MCDVTRRKSVDPGLEPRMKPAKPTKPGGSRKEPPDPQPHYGVREGHTGSTETMHDPRRAQGTNQEPEPWRWFVREILNPCA
ncbi:hypothetical protein BDP55DRAFT_71732 [Colletotrichum godetiae]|uniref:Uncharacterized protein n=1 Tax=Colletotrichum godetiae TaxID=1209918 RepID=A0AAJ0APB2_9PEZI|nr:uncharacterized protein BDP55DRAFT_71732 [Colletotrichum godetiae]KAK1687899.1 hypothetical protein BDP55DRAFT_71732 [Colletotrichum godetiae]